MRQAGVADYESFGRASWSRRFADRPFSFEVLSDDFDEMEHQALKIAAWGSDVFVQIPVTNTKGESAAPLIRRLVKRDNVRLNVTAILTMAQIDEVVAALEGHPSTPTSPSSPGVSPTPVCAPRAVHAPRGRGLQQGRRHGGDLGEPCGEVLSLNVFQADEIGCHVITVTPDILQEARDGGKGARRLLARHREDVLQRRRRGRFSALSTAPPLAPPGDGVTQDRLGPPLERP